MKNKLKNVIEVYYQSFNANKPELLTRILTEDVYLRDWEIEKQGKKEVIETSSEIMNLPNFDIDILNEIYEGEFAAVDIIVKVNDETLKVIDLFEFENYKIKSISHITGGGLIDNPPRAFNKNLTLKFDMTKFKLPPLFKWLKNKANISLFELAKTFNCGIGFLIFRKSAQISNTPIPVIKPIKRGCANIIIKRKSQRKIGTFLAFKK